MSDPKSVYPTREEAIGHAMIEAGHGGIEAGHGGIVVVHEAHCKSEDGETGCTCDPVTLTSQVGAA